MDKADAARLRALRRRREALERADAEAIRTALGRGASLREIARVLGYSHEKVRQLARKKR